ncbi:MAG: TIGR04211 family SH3 domain-containing protein [Gammaproteobacteria bacterium]|jgi:SH3 domain protein
MMSRLLIPLLLASLGQLAHAETAYVSDRLEITMRTGTSTQYSIIRMLPSGARLELLETDAASGYSRVRTTDGTEGWVLSRYLMDQPAAREQVASASERAGSLQLQVSDLSAQVEALTGERNALQAQRDGLEAEVAELRGELERERRVSAASLELDQANRELRTRVAATDQENARLRGEIDDLKRNTQRDWFLAGAGVLLLGLVLGLVLPRIRWRRRSGWGDL